MHGIRGNRRAAGVGLCALVLAAASSAARADEPKQRLLLKNGDRLEGRILCVSARHVLLDGAGFQRFVEISSIESAKEADGSTIDLKARETRETRDVVGLFLSIFNE